MYGLIRLSIATWLVEDLSENPSRNKKSFLQLAIKTRTPL